ncbi:hypothetical protein EXU57_19585 [Segetibacter sp. 3557_3]|uniref:hypothetical protein n=1 Tax=Segetibacter sp. 3557_3 TaxID=2547429 RepID=UPI0010584BF5|nr:hypothetical protein [Segetibacter sp. 3557_3]TDH21404.1 hypothetical protein EXU57_19585 [Segetibacter sp. 3557_3]
MKIVLIAAGIIAVSVLGFQLWFVSNARGVIRNFIAEKSKGSLKLELSELKFAFLSNTIQINEADIVSTDTLTQPITYHIRFNHLKLRVASVWPLLLRNQLLLDTIQLHNPVIEVFQWRKDTAQRQAKDELSLPQEMGKLYNSMLDALDEFGIRKISINNASISLVNKMKPGSNPVTMNRIYLDLSRNLKTAKKRVVSSTDQSVELKTDNQEIFLPGGRNKISFKKFKLQLFRQRIELDSCTLTARSSDSAKSSYRIFFKKLSLLGVDLNAMERYNVIKADSVYCEDPFFDINLFRSDAARRTSGVPDPDKILKELTGNLDLAFVGVRNAGIHLEINGKRKTSLSNSNKDDFTMRGLRIKPDSSVPVSVERFDMTVRDYHLYNHDSSTTYKFDSLHFLNDKVVLNNFSVLTTPGKSRQKSYRNFTIPYFELTSVDWYQLIFDQNLVAEAAYLRNPVIIYSRMSKNVPGKRTNIFNSLQSMDNLMTLNRIIVEHGDVKFRTGVSTALNFRNVDLSISSDRLLQSKNRQGLQNAVDRLSFSDGSIHIKGLTAQLENARYTGNKLVYADRLKISGKDDAVRATINGVLLDNLQFDNDGNNIEIDGLHWKSASVALKSSGSAGNRDKETNINITDISGNNTQFDLIGDATTVSGFVNTLEASSIVKQGDQPLTVRKLLLDGKNLALQAGNFTVRSKEYKISSGNPSYLKEVQIDNDAPGEKINITAPDIRFITSIGELPTNRFLFSKMEVDQPKVMVETHKTNAQIGANVFPYIGIEDLEIKSPELDIRSGENDTAYHLQLPYAANSVIRGRDMIISADSSSAASFLVQLSTASITKDQKRFALDSGKLDIDLANIRFRKHEGGLKWNGLIKELTLESKSGLANQQKLKGFRFNEFYAGNLNLGSDDLTDLAGLLRKNPAGWIKVPGGEYMDSTRHLKWYNAAYSSKSNQLHVDSFVYKPSLSLEATLAKAKYRGDYITLAAGGLTIEGFDADRYEQENSFYADGVTITRPQINIYKDKILPFNAGRIKLLPATLIMGISSPVHIKNINVRDGHVTYTEKDSSSRKDGRLVITRLNGGISDFSNQSTNSIDSLRINVNGFLMDTLPLQVAVTQSYTDPGWGFKLKVKAGQAPFKIFNTIVTPLSNISFTSGVLDSAFLEADANDELAFGTMKLYYHHLKMQTVQDGKPAQKSFKNKLINFVINTFILKKHARGDKSLVYFKRLPDRSFLNYLVKTTLSGLATGTGLKSDKKYLRAYRKTQQATQQ